MKTKHGYCQCGCGQKTKIAKQTDSVRGNIKGNPQKYMVGHSSKTGRDANERFWSLVDKKDSDSCWEWKAGTHQFGYGTFWFLGKNITAHRYSYQLAKGKIPKGMLVCHSCDNPKCVNPNHLFLGTYADNVNDMMAKGRNPDKRGERHHLAKLTNKDVQEIRQLAAQGISKAEIAKRKGIDQSTVSRIVNHKRWLHI